MLFVRRYVVRQFNSQNGPVKAKFAYLCTSGCCRLRNTLLVKLCTSWDDGATAGNSHENHFPEYLAITFSRCVGCQKGQQIFVPSGPSVLCVFGCSLLGSSCTSSRPSLNSLRHSKTLDFFIAYSLYATFNMANVSLALLPIFTQNLMFIRCSRFLSLIFPPAIYHGHVLPLLLGNERLIWSVAHVNVSWNMSRRAWVHEFAWLNTPATRCDYSVN